MSNTVAPPQGIVPPIPANQAPSTSIGEYFKMGIGLSLGSHVVTIAFTIIGMIFFIPGFILVMKESKKPKGQKSRTKLIIGFILMILGMILGMSFGLGIIIAMFSGEMGEF